MKNLVWILSSILVLACSGSVRKQTAIPGFLEDTALYPRVFETISGIIYLNGKPTSVHRIESKVGEVVGNKGIVLYAYEDSLFDLPEKSLVVTLFKKYQVDIQAYYDSSFTRPRY